MSRLILALVTAWSLLMSAHAREQSPTSPNSPAAHQNGFVLDLAAGRILGATLGMDETTTKAALAKNHIADIEKVKYPTYFVLQSPDCLGIIFNFRDNKELNDIYTNSRAVTLSNGLKLGDSLKKFTEVLGQPSSPKPLPSGVGDELVYPLGSFELGIIRLNTNPEVAHALTLRKRK